MLPFLLVGVGGILGAEMRPLGLANLTELILAHLHSLGQGALVYLVLPGRLTEVPLVDFVHTVVARSARIVGRFLEKRTLVVVLLHEVHLHALLLRLGFE